MAQPIELTDLINDIYDAALDSSLWPKVLRRTMALLGGVSAAIFCDATLSADSFYSSVDIDPLFAAAYVLHYVSMNPLVPFEQTLPAGSVFSASSLMPYERLRASPFFNEWARPQGFVDFIGAVIDKSMMSMVKLIVNRDERRGPVDDEARRALQVLTPHFQRAVAIGKALERCESKVRAFSDVLDRLSAAVVFVDRAGHIVYANGPAERMLADGDALSRVEGQLRVKCARAAAHLQRILGSATRGNPSAECAAFSTTDASRDGERLAVHVVPVSAGSHRHALVPCGAAAGIVVSTCTPDLSQRVPTAARLYALTPGESRVIQALMGGGTVSRIAKALGISEATVKTHLQHIFDKTGTRRQVDLMQRIADCAHPLFSEAGGEGTQARDRPGKRNGESAAEDLPRPVE